MTSRNPKKIELKMERILNAWETLAPTKSFGGLTLEQMQAIAAPARATRARIEDLEDQLTEALADRAHADLNVRGGLEIVVNAVRADLTEGPDSALYEAMGYRRRSERRSGLTRKKRKPSSEGDD